MRAQASYGSFWARRVLAALVVHRGSVSIVQLSEQSALHVNDVLETLQAIFLEDFSNNDYFRYSATSFHVAVSDMYDSGACRLEPGAYNSA